MNRRARLALRFGSGVLLALAVALTASAGWIHAKALVAQALLQQAWDQSNHGQRAIKPWSWADFAPLARLRLPSLDQSFIVLNKDSGQALAFGPGWSPSSAAPASHGLTVISAHRDTQFSALAQLRQGDPIQIDAAAGHRAYRVRSMRVVDSHRTRIGSADSRDALLLVTCYPFDAIVPGGPLRYVVEAVPMTPASP
ncbi:MAG TPA: class GN sortase [Rhodanobacteraceae bacterium]|nr:class GN sortase [Rhodanobacteraceae bacterium]